MYAVTERGVVGRQVDCSILWLQWLQSSYCPDWSLSRWQRGSRTQQIGDVVGLAKTSQAHSQQPGTEAPVHAGTCRPSPPVCRQYAYEREASEVHARWAWCDQTSWSPSSRELRRSVQPGASSADRHSRRTEDCCSSLDGCLWTREQASLLSQR